MTLEQLKAAAYDCIANKETWEVRLREINQAIANYKEPVTAPLPDSAEAPTVITE